MNEDDPNRLCKRRIQYRFEEAAKRYDRAAVLQRVVADRLLERVRLIRLQPQRILDLGAGTGYAVRELMRRYRKSEVHAVDLASSMLHRARRRAPLLRKLHCTCADLHALPYADNSFDLVFSNLALQWSHDLGAALAELQRVTAPEGAVFFSTFGAQTLYELRQAWQEVDTHTHVHAFADKRDIANTMLAVGLLDPVVDGERFVLTYSQPREAMRELKTLGATNAAAGRPRGLYSPHRLARVEAAYSIAFRQADGRVPATYDVAFGHAWGRAGGAAQQPDQSEARIDLSAVRRREG